MFLLTKPEVLCSLSITSIKSAEILSCPPPSSANFINLLTHKFKSELSLIVFAIILSVTSPVKPSLHNKNLSPFLAFIGSDTISTSTESAIPKALVNSFFLGCDSISASEISPLSTNV